MSETDDETCATCKHEAVTMRVVEKTEEKPAHVALWCGLPCEGPKKQEPKKLEPKEYEQDEFSPFSQGFMSYFADQCPPEGWDY